MALQKDKMKGKLALVTTRKIRYEVMLSYDPEDAEVVKKIKDMIGNKGIHAWMADLDATAGTDIFNAIGRIIVDCKMFLFIMSKASVSSKLCQDQLALAYVSKKNICPVQLNERNDLLDHMDNGMKLQLAGFEWFSLCNDMESESKDLVNKICEEVQAEIEAEKTGSSKPDLRKSFKRQKTLTNLNKSLSKTKMSRLHLEDATTYWNQSFDKETTISWEKFRTKLLKDFKDDFEETFGDKDTEWLMSILHREMMESSDEMLKKENYIEFCSVDDVVHPLWLRIQEQARESYAMREVFRMDSSVRVQAIENLGKYKSATVIDALLDLLTDNDVNIQAVAIISLARTGSNDIETIVSLKKCLKSKDRVVREAACLALGHVKATSAVELLVNLWRNDIISNVREAALIGLKNIGGEKADEAIRMTTVLEKEIRALKT
ncbi:uncharacterized protein LOC125659773 isoform X2 [Ostrea edulis]|uniref:uncharacterized protein LOC125659773 isoform X2 n=1 Tax=Ostrea edulis TaxID=37623 RepID=UPI0024AEB472|nr:uncharacterized protein LOC125659773 isoform X2 [Ostrea edulis]